MANNEKIEKIGQSLNKMNRTLVDLQDSVNDFPDRWTDDPHMKAFIIGCVREAVRAELARSAGRSGETGDGRRGNAEISPAGCWMLCIYFILYKYLFLLQNNSTSFHKLCAG